MIYEKKKKNIKINHHCLIGEYAPVALPGFMKYFPSN